MAYRIHLDVVRDRWYLTASWQRPAVKTGPSATARAQGLIGVDTNADHFAAYRLDAHGNPIGDPRRFSYDLSGSADHRDAQVRHAITRLLHWADRCGVAAIGIEDLDFTAGKTREQHGGRKRFRHTSRWGGQHWQKPLVTPRRTMTRHDAASVAIGRRPWSPDPATDGTAPTRPE